MKLQPGDSVRVLKADAAEKYPYALCDTGGFWAVIHNVNVEWDGEKFLGCTAPLIGVRIEFTPEDLLQELELASNGANAFTDLHGVIEQLAAVGAI